MQPDEVRVDIGKCMMKAVTLSRGVGVVGHVSVEVVGQVTSVLDKHKDAMGRAGVVGCRSSVCRRT